MKCCKVVLCYDGAIPADSFWSLSRVSGLVQYQIKQSDQPWNTPGYDLNLVCLEYRIGQKTIPKIGKLFAFSNEEQAINWFNKVGWMFVRGWKVALVSGTGTKVRKPQLKKCELPDDNGSYMATLSLSWFSAEQVKRFWKLPYKERLNRREFEGGSICRFHWDGGVLLNDFTPEKVVTFSQVSSNQLGSFDGGHRLCLTD